MTAPCNILFYTGRYAAESGQGGTEIAVARRARFLKSRGFRVFNMYERGEGGSDDLYEGRKVIPGNADNKTHTETVARFIVRNDIDVIFNEGNLFRQQLLLDSVKLSGRDVEIIFIPHYGYGDEMIKSRARWLLRSIVDRENRVWNLLRLSLFPAFYLRKRYRYRLLYRQALATSWHSVFLSEGNRRRALNRLGIQDDARFHVIPDIIPTVQNVDIGQKEKSVLVLSRMDEAQKRIGLALKIWRIVISAGKYEDWRLDIVGDGRDLKRYRRYVSKHGIKNVVFHGWQDSEEFLRNASVLMVTSRYEGFCMSIAEAQSAGCVPMAFDSFAAAREVIEDGQTGILVEKFGDIKDYAAKLKGVMDDKTLRERMAAEARESARRFDEATVGPQWLPLLT